MFQRLIKESILKNNLYSLPIHNLQLIKAPGRERIGFWVFLNKERRLSFYVDTSRNPQDLNCLKREFEAGQEIKGLTQDSQLLETIAMPLAFDKEMKLAFYLPLANFGGRVLIQELNQNYRPKNILKLMLDWLIRFQKATLIRYENQVPLTYLHGDFTPHNIWLTREGEIKVFDWEDSQREGMGPLDLIHFILVLTSTYKQRRRDLRDNFRKNWQNRKFKAIIVSLVKDYCQEMACRFETFNKLIPLYFKNYKRPLHDLRFMIYDL